MWAWARPIYISAPMTRRFTRLAWLAATCTYLLIILGAIVRITASGLGCGEHWPLCNGRLLPPLDLPTLIEYGHRLAAAAVSVLVTALAAYAWWLRRRPPPPSTALHRPGVAAYVALALLILQIGLGAVTVKLQLPPWTVILHLGAPAHPGLAPGVRGDDRAGARFCDRPARRAHRESRRGQRVPRVSPVQRTAHADGELPAARPMGTSAARLLVVRLRRVVGPTDEKAWCVVRDGPRHPADRGRCGDGAARIAPAPSGGARRGGRGRVGRAGARGVVRRPTVRAETVRAAACADSLQGRSCRCRR